MERRLRNGDIARFEPGRPGGTRYLYHQNGRYWMLSISDRGGELEKQWGRAVSAFHLSRMYNENDVEVVSADQVPGPVTALSGAAATE